MSRAVLILGGKAQRDRATAWVAKAPINTRVEFREPKRSLPQNDRMWAMLTDIAKQRPNHNGAKMTADLWKAVFMQALGAEMTMLPTLECDGFFPIGLRSSELSKSEMSDLMELMTAWGAAHGVTFHDQAVAA